MIPIFDTVRIFFRDGTETVTHVLDEDTIQEQIVDICDDLGISSLDVADYKIESTTYATEDEN